MQDLILFIDFSKALLLTKTLVVRFGRASRNTLWSFGLSKYVRPFSEENALGSHGQQLLGWGKPLVHNGKSIEYLEY